MTTKKINAIVAVFLICLVQLISFFVPAVTAQAQASGGSSSTTADSNDARWVDAYTIIYKKVKYARRLYHDGNCGVINWGKQSDTCTSSAGEGDKISDEYFSSKDNGKCENDFIRVSGDKSKGNFFKSKSFSSGNCGEESSTGVSITDKSKSTYTAYQISNDEIFMAFYHSNVKGSLRENSKMDVNGTFKRLSKDDPDCKDHQADSSSDKIDKGKCTLFTLGGEAAFGGEGKHRVINTQPGHYKVVSEVGATDAPMQAVQVCSTTHVGPVSHTSCSGGGPSHIVFANDRAITKPEEAAKIDDGGGDAAVAGDCDGLLPNGWGLLNPAKLAKGALDWFGCVVIKGVLSVASQLNDAIDSLLATNTDLYTGPDVQNAWGRFLVIANSLFVIAFLIMILSTALDLGFVDAYTVKKFLPRIIVAVILTNLSFSFIKIAIELTNSLGGNIEAIIMGPVKAKDVFQSITASTASGAVGATTGAALGVAVAGFATAGIFALIPTALTILMGFITAWAVITIRRIIILLLIVVSPIAIAMWVIPGLDSWAKRWWKLFLEMLMVYPFIKAILASGLFTAWLVRNTSKGSDFGTSLSILGAVILPYLLIPTVFKLASSTLSNVTGMINNKSKGLIDRSKKKRNEKMRQGYERKYAPRILAKRADVAGKLQSRASGSGKVGGLLMRQAARGVGGYNMEAAMSARNAQEMKVLKDQIATGRDDDIRGLSVNRKAVNAGNTARKIKQADGSYAWDRNIDDNSVLARTDENGKRQYKSLGGAWVDEANVIEGHRRWGNNQFAQQASLSYEMQKAMTDDQIQGVSDRYKGLAKDSWGNSDRQASGTWIGAGFENQNQSIEYKNTDWNSGKVEGKKFAREVYEKKGSYPLSQMSGHTITQLGNTYDDAQTSYGQARTDYIAAQASGDTAAMATATSSMNEHKETMDMVAAVSETFVQRGAQAGGIIGQTADGTPVTGGGGASGTYGSGGAAVNEKINWLAEKTGRLKNAPTNPHPGPDSRQN